METYDIRILSRFPVRFSMPKCEISVLPEESDDIMRSQISVLEKS